MKKASLILLVAALGWGACLLAPGPLLAGVIEGRVVRGSEPLTGMRVEAFDSLDFSRPALARADTDDEGLYRLELPAGLYALFARSGAGDIFAFCGKNPVAVADGKVWAGLQAVAVAAVETTAYADEYSGAIEGRVLLDGQPLAGAHVYLYLDAAEDLKGPGYRMSPPTAGDGRFAFDALPESGYFVVARKREQGGRVGPVAEGDALGIFPANPLYVSAGKTKRIEISLARKIQQEAASETFVRATGMALRGKITDPAGQPVAGVHVFAYTDRVIGHQRPAALSPPTGADGAFTVYLKEPGTYYVGAREHYGDSPAPGELFGMYEGSADHGMAIESGQQVDDLHLVVEPVDLGF